MRKNPVIAIVGATGLVGNEILVCLEESKIDFADLKLFASEESEGEIYSCRDVEYKVERLEEDSFEGVTIALFALSPTLAAQYIPRALEAGAVVIDSSNAFEEDDTVPHVVPGVNFDVVRRETSMITSPGSGVVILAPVLGALAREGGLKRVVLSSYQAVSGAGKIALDELWSQTLAIFNQREIESEAFQHQIAFNCIPQVGVLRGDGSTREEYRVAQELRRVLALPNLRVSSTAVRVPVFHSYAYSVNVELEREITPAACAEFLAKEPGVALASDPLDYPMQLDVTGSDSVHVGRIRKDDSVDHGLMLWVVGDNVRRGAALNMLEIVERLIARFGE